MKRSQEKALKRDRYQESPFYKRAMLTLIGLLFPAALVGITNDNPAAPNLPEFGFVSSRESIVTWKMGYSWENVFNKRIEITGVKEAVDPPPCWRQARLAFQYHLALAALTLSDRVELYTAAGVMKLNVAASFVDETKTPWTFTGGIGGRALLIYWERAMMGVHARYQRARLGFEGSGGEEKGAGLTHFTYNEWEVGLSVTGEIKWLYPYVGLAYYKEQSRLHVSAIPHTLKVKNKEPFVFLIGLSFSAEKGGAFTVEGRCLGEQAIAVTGNIRF